MTIPKQKTWTGVEATSSDFNNYTGPCPATVDINALAFSSIIRTGTWTPTNLSTCLYGGYNVSDGAQNDALGWDVLLGAGTWTLGLTYRTNTDAGIATVQLSTDGVTFTTVNASPYNGSAGTVDMYAAVAAPNVNTTITGITIGANGIYRLQLLAATKNGSSSSYKLYPQHMHLHRTA